MFEPRTRPSALLPAVYARQIPEGEANMIGAGDFQLRLLRCAARWHRCLILCIAADNNSGCGDCLSFILVLLWRCGLLSLIITGEMRYNKIHLLKQLVIMDIIGRVLPRQGS
jgi:hypothetical protein